MAEKAFNRRGQFAGTESFEQFFGTSPESKTLTLRPKNMAIPLIRPSNKPSMAR
jgi:hypothetical protein